MLKNGTKNIHCKNLDKKNEVNPLQGHKKKEQQAKNSSKP